MACTEIGEMLTPMFTPSKLKEMFDLILECANHFERYLDQLTAKNEIVDFSDATAKYTTDVIGSCMFGKETKSISDKNNDFHKLGREIFAMNFENVMRLKMRLYAPKLYNWLGYIITEKRFTTFFTKLVTNTMKYKKKHNMLMKLKEHPEKKLVILVSLC
ncbi:hypothetical protein K0M31_015792 [Melipona bicolor]|uniref:Cytochrome P450 n=1 Tax=Melipona bicolor TaxID=60889 RepID=A0AA40FEZ4_9HYME|nr:hypothetical protein K0M31_015792 [Melipona bicolor]